MHHSQQDLKNRVYQRRIKVFRLQESQETRFLALVQDMSKRKTLSSAAQLVVKFRPEGLATLKPNKAGM